MAAPEGLAERVAAAGRRCSLTTSVLQEWSRRGTPRQVEYLAEYLEAECRSRDASKRAGLLGRCALPQPKTFDGYEWGQISWPEGFGRDELLSLSFLDAHEDLVLMGDVGTGKTHMAEALCTLAFLQCPAASSRYSSVYCRGSLLLSLDSAFSISLALTDISPLQSPGAGGWASGQSISAAGSCRPPVHQKITAHSLCGWGPTGIAGVMPEVLSHFPLIHAVIYGPSG